MYKLYGYKGSGSAAVEMALNAAKAPYEVIDVASWDTSSPIPELTSANPLSQIPTLVLPDSTVLTESAAILIHLGDTFPQAGILATEPAPRAKTIQGLVYLAANCYPAVGIIDYPERWTRSTSKEVLEEIRAGTRDRYFYLWEVFADRFTGEPFLSGSQPGILDFLAVTIGRMCGARKHLEKARPEFDNLLTTLERHPLLGPTVAKHWNG